MGFDGGPGRGWHLVWVMRSAGDRSHDVPLWIFMPGPPTDSRIPPSSLSGFVEGPLVCRLASPVDAGPLRPRASEASSPQARASPFSSLLRTAVLNSGQFCTPGDPGWCLERFSRQNSGGGAAGIQWIESGMLPNILPEQDGPHSRTIRALSPVRA